MFKIIFYKQTIPLIGFKFKIAGRLGGRLRKSCFIYVLGSIKKSSFTISANYTCDTALSQYGVFSLKCWYYYCSNIYEI